MPFFYDNAKPPYYSEAARTFETPQDWTIGGVTDLSLWIRGLPTNSPDDLYITLRDSSGRIGVAVNPDPMAVNVDQWTQWQIPLSQFSTAGVNVSAVKRMYIGVGDRNNPQPNGEGEIYIDDICLTRRMP